MRVLLYGMLRAEGRRGASAKRKNGGFTLLEMLLTVAVLVILLGLAAVGVARWLHPLKITELDNAAREIYMAAENRVVLLKNSGVAPKRLENADPYPGPVTGTSADGTETPVSLRVLSNTTNTDILNDMLPVGSIDPALREGYFYILYDESTSHVFEVFYAEKEFDEDDLDDLRVSRSERVEYYRKDTATRCLVGHYAGGLADEISNKESPEPDVKVEIVNKDELTLTVTYKVPTDLPTGVSVTRKPKVTLKYGEKEITLLDENGNTLYFHRLIKNDNIISDASLSATYTWVLDALPADSTAKAQQFWNLFEEDTSVHFGGDFTVTASLELTADDYIGSFNSDEGTDNSLFAKDSHNTENAFIENLRHLQNLDNIYSNAAGKSTAIQRADIDASVVQDNKGTVKNSDYEFRPIDNWALTSYISSLSTEGENSSYHLIKNLKITPASARNGHAALFAAIGENAQIQNVRLIDADISNNGVAGALIGYVASVNCTNCLVKNVKVNSASNFAGGLAGGWWGSAKFENCVVENATVNGGSSAGGMTGHGPNAIFTDCVVRGNIEVSGNVVGGLAGSTESSKDIVSKFENCRVFIDETDNVTATVKGTEAAGGLVGRTKYAEFTTCTVGNEKKKIELNARDYAGGLVGNPVNGGFKDCKAVHANVATTGEYSEAGGLVGRLEKNDLTIEILFTNCSAEDIQVEGKMNAGGLAGSTTRVIVKECTATDVTANAESYAGGLAGNSTEDQYTDCKAINASATCTSTAGGLVGAATVGKFDSCRVYWENTSKLGSGNNLNYQVVAVTAGGLAGEVKEGGTIQNSFAATLVQGSVYAGGLVGNLPGSNAKNVTIEKSYADCYILIKNNATGNFYAGGLIGIKTSGFSLTLKDVYVAGFIRMEAATGSYREASGLCGGWRGLVEITAQNAYVAMHYSGNTAGYDLAEGMSTSKCYFLNNVWGGVSTPYNTMAQASFVTTMGSAFTKNPDTHRYGLGDNADNGTSPYPFPGLKDMPHYGDWLKKP